MNTQPSEVQRATLLSAIRVEERNSTVYETLAQLFQGYDNSVTAIFGEMAAEERRHRAELEEHYCERFGPVPFLIAEPREVIEAPDLEDPEALIFDSMSEKQALTVALHAEEGAREFYRREASRTSDAELKKVYIELSGFEENHVRLLMQKIAEKGEAAIQR
jgi:rubrerythrin